MLKASGGRCFEGGKVERRVISGWSLQWAHPRADETGRRGSFTTYRALLVKSMQRTVIRGVIRDTLNHRCNVEFVIFIAKSDLLAPFNKINKF